jgi:hypothetical protein
MKNRVEIDLLIIKTILQNGSNPTCFTEIHKILSQIKKTSRSAYLKHP